MLSFCLNSLRQLAAATAIAACAATAASAGQYIGGDLNLDLDDTDDVRIIAADVTAVGSVAGDVVIFAADVGFRVSVGQDLTIFAADINVDGEVAGDAELYGASVSVTQPIGGDLNIGAADISVFSRVSGYSQLSGALVVVEPSAELLGGSQISAREVYAEGRFGGVTELRGAEVHISGVVEGPLEVYARDVFIDSQAVITGPVTIRSPNEPEIGEGAQIGELSYVETRFDMDDVSIDGANFSFDGGPSFLAIGGVFASSAFLLGIFLALLFPRSLGRISDRFRARPWVSGGLGLILYATFWLLMLTLAVLLIATVVGILLAPLVIFAIPIMYFLAFIFGGVVIGDLILNRSGGQAGFLLRVGSLAAVMIVLTALYVLPPLGVFVAVIVNCIGFGAWTLAVFDRQKPAISVNAGAPEGGAV
jgi:cytoskeletal protein CcmA (bactofilin family)